MLLITSVGPGAGSSVSSIGSSVATSVSSTGGASVAVSTAGAGAQALKTKVINIKTDNRTNIVRFILLLLIYFFITLSAEDSTEELTP
jgi:hypothetical protein